MLESLVCPDPVGAPILNGSVLFNKL